MRLESLFTHRLVRALRVVVPILLLVLIVIPAWNYLSRRAQAVPPKIANRLPGNLAVRTEGFSHSRTEGGKTLFTIRANTTVGFKDTRYMLEGVDVTINGETASDMPKRIRSKYCSYDQQSNDFKFEGNVEAQLDEKTSIRTEELNYSQQSRTVISSKETTLDQPGSMNGRADSFEYGLDTGLLKLDGHVVVATPAQTSLEAGSALFQQKENWVTMAGGVFIKSGSGWIRGQSGRSDLIPGSYKPKTITIETDVTAESQGQGGFSWKLRAARLEADISPLGVAEHVRTRGKVEIERVGGDGRQVITGDEIDGNLDAAGKVTMLEARQNAQMIFGDGRTLQSNLIWINGAGEIATRDQAILRLGDSTIEGRKFVIKQGDIVTFSTTERADLRSGERKTSADRTEGRFDSKTNSLMELVQSGNFQFAEGTRTGRAQSARFENGGTIITLEGTPVVTDAQMRLEAGRIRLDQKESSFVATDNVKTVTRNSAEPVLVTAAKADGANDRIVYTQGVQLWRGSAYIRTERLEVSGRNNSLHAEGRVHSNIEGVRATSDKLDYDDASRLAHYTGSVRAEKQGTILETRDMTARHRDKDVEEIVATGGVVVTQGDRRGTGDKAVYELETQTVTLTGDNAEVYDKEQGTVHGTRLVMNTKGDSMVAEGAKPGRSVTKHQVTK